MKSRRHRAAIAGAAALVGLSCETSGNNENDAEIEALITQTMAVHSSLAAEYAATGQFNRSLLDDAGRHSRIDSLTSADLLHICAISRTANPSERSALLAILVMRQSDAPCALDAVVSAVSDSDVGVRVVALAELPLFGAVPKVLGTLRGVLSEPQSRELHDVAIQSLETLKASSPEAQEILEGIRPERDKAS